MPKKHLNKKNKKPLAKNSRILTKLEIILISIFVITTSAMLLTTRALAEPIGEQTGGSPDSEEFSVLMEIYDELVSLDFGDETGSLGPLWNRIYNSATWVPDATATESDVVEGKTFFSISSRVEKTGVSTSLLDCPEGMIVVPAGNGGSSFCVDKYEAKQVDGLAVSQASGTPWVSISQFAAREACSAVGKHLITEQEWLQIARDVEQVGWNWSGGTPGSGVMSDGHSDNDPGNSLAASTDDDPCFGTNNECDIDTWHSQRRTYKLSNGEYIWDLGGNVWNWVDGFTFENQPYANNWSSWTACTTPDSICGNTLSTNDQRFGGNTTALRAFPRGGRWANGTRAGVFAIDLDFEPSSTRTLIGFRCAR